MLTPTGFEYKECKWSKITRYDFNNFIKTTFRDISTNKIYRVVYGRIGGWVEFSYDIKDRLYERGYYTMNPPNDGNRWHIEYLWPTTGNIRIKSLPDITMRGSYELRRPNGTLKYTETRREWKRYTREYYDKTGTIVVARCDYEIINGKIICTNRVIKGGWH
ncbi:hypothetical protein D5b_00026 [Faustovirus]|nr:hypothetical protein D5b_00026 [Faustovirus]AMN84883.1 hypothetical protein D6_00484 [Faustovirus]AMP43985.1 hypothetical protein PRJ_Dakar_00025 [Faustovirus]